MVANQDVIYLAISGNQLPKIAENLVTTMNKEEIDRLIFMGAIGIYNEIPDDIGGKDNVDNNPSQVPNMEVVNIIEQSNLNYTILRPGYLRDGEVDDFVLTKKGQLAKGLITTISSLVSIAEDMMNDDSLYSRESISITKEATK